MNVKKDGFMYRATFPDQLVMPGVLIVEAFGLALQHLAAGIAKKNMKINLL